MQEHVKKEELSKTKVTRNKIKINNKKKKYIIK